MGHLPSIKQLKYLCAVAEHNHFGKAAEACFVSQSSLSSGIKELEEALEVKLFERTNKKVMVTQIGQEIVARAQSILNQADDLVATAQASHQPFSTEMRLGVIPTIAPYILPKLLTNIRKKYPDFTLYIQEELSAHLLHDLENGHLDVLLLALPFPAENVDTMHLFYDEFLLACHKDHQLQNKDQLTTSDLKQQDVLLLKDGHCMREHALDACHISTNDVAVPYQASSLNTIVQMVANNIGITLMPEMALNKNILQGTDVVTKNFDEKNVHRSIGLMWRNQSPRVAEFKLFGQLIQDTYD